MFRAERFVTLKHQYLSSRPVALECVGDIEALKTVKCSGLLNNVRTNKQIR